MKQKEDIVLQTKFKIVNLITKTRFLVVLETIKIILGCIYIYLMQEILKYSTASLRIYEIPVWIGVVMIISGFIGLVAASERVHQYIGSFKFKVLKFINMTGFSAAALACSFAMLVIETHYEILLGHNRCVTGNETDTSFNCTCQTTMLGHRSTYYHYNDLSCADVFDIFQPLIIVAMLFFCIGIALSLLSCISICDNSEIEANDS